MMKEIRERASVLWGGGGAGGDGGGGGGWKTTEGKKKQFTCKSRVHPFIPFLWSLLSTVLLFTVVDAPETIWRGHTISLTTVQQQCTNVAYCGIVARRKKSISRRGHDKFSPLFTASCRKGSSCRRGSSLNLITGVQRGTYRWRAVLYVCFLLLLHWVIIVKLRCRCSLWHHRGLLVVIHTLLRVDSCWLTDWPDPHGV